MTIRNPFANTGTPLDQLGALIQPSFDAAGQAFGQLSAGVRQYTGNDPLAAVQQTWRDPLSYSGGSDAQTADQRNRKRGGTNTF